MTLPRLPSYHENPIRSRPTDPVSQITNRMNLVPCYQPPGYRNSLCLVTPARRRFRLANRAFVRIASVGRLADEGGADGGAEAAKYCACYAAPNALSKLPMFSERSFLSSSAQALYRASVCASRSPAPLYGSAMSPCNPKNSFRIMCLFPRPREFGGFVQALVHHQDEVRFFTRSAVRGRVCDPSGGHDRTFHLSCAGRRRSARFQLGPGQRHKYR